MMLTLLLVDLLLDVEVDAKEQDVGEYVEGSDSQQDLWILKRYLLGELHHP